MKKVIYFTLTLMLTFSMFSCTSVDSGHRAVLVEFGKVQDEVLDEGFHVIAPWLDAVEYDVRQKTIKEEFEFYDRNNMKVPVSISIDRSLISKSVNKIQSEIGKDQIEIKEMNSLAAAAMQIIPQYSASELNLSKREEAETKIHNILKKTFPEFYVLCTRVRITSVGIPKSIAETAEQNAAQIERNNLSAKKVEESKNNNEAAEWDAKTKAILSQPQMLELKKLDIEQALVAVKMEYAKKGVSPFGSNNVFSDQAGILKGFK